MAVFFLDGSPTYVQRTDPNILQRRRTICENLQDNYTVRRDTNEEVYTRITAELGNKNITLTPAAYQTDKATLRAAYTWLLAETKGEKEKIRANTGDSIRSGINCLMKDGLYNWADLNLGAALPPEEVVEESPSAQPKPVEHEANHEALSCAVGLVESLKALINNSERLKTENANLVAENARLVEKTVDSEAYNEYANNENALLEDKLLIAKEEMKNLRSTQLEEIAVRYPEFPQLMLFAQQLKEGAGRRQKQIQDIFRDLPQAFKWANDSGAVIYQPTFLEALADLQQKEQRQAIAQLKTLVSQGPEYASLHTRKILMQLPHSPLGCFTSRGASDIRFTWTKNGKITVYWLYRKGDSRVRQSEA